VLEALDHPNEYFYDKNTHTLYYSPNASSTTNNHTHPNPNPNPNLHGPPSPSIRLVAGHLQTLIAANATENHPVTDVTIQVRV